MQKRIIIPVLFLFFCASIAPAQDIHFSQFQATPLNLNPALAGGFDGDIRAVGNHKRQWLTFTNAYQTFSASVDAVVPWLRLGKSFFGAGLLFNTDKAGDASFGTNQVRLCASYHLMLTNDSALNLSAGMNGGYNQHNINYNALTFGSQYNGNQYDPFLPNGETFGNDNISYLDVSAGVNMSYMINRELSVNSGLVLNHINKPTQSFWNIDKSELDRRFTFHGGLSWKLNKDLVLLPGFSYQKQVTMHEFNMGGLLKMNIDNISLHAIYAGGWMRSKDAGIIEVRFDYRSFNFGISYDINYSKLNTISKGRGGLELSLIYIYKKYKDALMPYYKKCPVYM